ncbi:MAG: hypothetical protein F6K61_21570 [Sphaerospermopsis sp. SIO1G1]|nr:hypothetical protein [Sphaerospermopsis sp. SIO1G1]
MSELTLKELMPGAWQAEKEISIKKADVGLNPSDATADQLIAALVIKAREKMTKERFDTVYEQKVYITDGFDGFITKNNGTKDVQHVERQMVIHLTLPDDATLNPNDY